MPYSHDTPHLRDFVPPSSDQVTSFPAQAYGRYDAPEGNAYAQGGYATPKQVFPQTPPIAYPNQSSQQQQQLAPGQFPGYCSFDPYEQAARDWTQSVDLTTFLPAAYEPQGELIQELQDRKDPTNEFSIPGAVDWLAPLPRSLPQRLATSPKMKRKSDAAVELQAMVQQSANEQQNPSKRRVVSRASSTASQSPAPTVLADAQPSPIANVAQIAASANHSSIQNNNEAQRRKNVTKGTGPQGREIDVSEPRRVVESSDNGDMLPAGKVFPIQIGSTLYRLSGASLCSDAPSYFSHFFSEQLHSNGGRANDVRTLYIDRDPDTFRDIALHLQGYHIVPRDGEHFVKLFADAQFYSLPRLTKQLFKSDIFISIGGQPFRIPRDTFSAPGDSPNYFSLGFAQWFSTPNEVFPGLDRNVLLRPPSISPPSVPNKSGETFGELLKMMQGYEVEIRGEVHRGNLLRDARYYHFKGLEQKLVPHEMSYNLKKQQNEIVIRLEDIRQSGVSFLPDPALGADVEASSTAGYVSYARPYTDDATANHVLVLETSSSESSTLHLPPLSSAGLPTILNAHVTFHADTLLRMTSLVGVIASKMGLPFTQPLSLSGNFKSRAHVRIDSDCALTVDGKEAHISSRTHESELDWVVCRAQWRIRVEPARIPHDDDDDDDDANIQVVLEAVKMEAYTKEKTRNVSRGFLGSG